MTRPFSLSLAVSLLVGCPSGEPPPAEPMEVAGSYVLVAQQLDTECVGPSWDYWEIFDFMERTANDVPSMAIIVTQDGATLVGTQSPAGCVLSGSVGAEGAFSLRGACPTPSMDRELALSGTIAPYGSGFDVDGGLVIEVDRDDGAGGPPDGTVDCTVTSVEISGSGTPAD